MSDDTRERLRRLAALGEGATPGPWAHRSDGCLVMIGDGLLACRPADAALIAHAPDLPALATWAREVLPVVEAVLAVMVRPHTYVCCGDTLCDHCSRVLHGSAGHDPSCPWVVARDALEALLRGPWPSSDAEGAGGVE